MLRKSLSVIPVPTSNAEVAEFISRLREAKRKIEQRTLTANNRINALQTALAAETAPLQQEVEILAEGLLRFATANRLAITDNGRVQTVQYATGRLGWRSTPPRVEVRKVDAVIAWIKQHRLLQFLRTKEEVNKEAMLDDTERAETVPGVSIIQDEVFYIWPEEFDTEIEVAKSRLKRRSA